MSASSQGLHDEDRRRVPAFGVGSGIPESGQRDSWQSSIRLCTASCGKSGKPRINMSAPLDLP